MHELPVNGVLGNWASGIMIYRKLKTIRALEDIGELLENPESKCDLSLVPYLGFPSPNPAG